MLYIWENKRKKDFRLTFFPFSSIKSYIHKKNNIYLPPPGAGKKTFLGEMRRNDPRYGGALYCAVRSAFLSLWWGVALRSRYIIYIYRAYWFLSLSLSLLYIYIIVTWWFLSSKVSWRTTARWQTDTEREQNKKRKTKSTGWDDVVHVRRCDTTTTEAAPISRDVDSKATPQHTLIRVV